MSNIRESRMADDLRDLTEALADAGWQPSGGGLGGEYGYGVDYENDVFEMHPFWWGECECGFDARESDWEESHVHADECYQHEILRRGFIDYEDPRHESMPWNDVHEFNQRVTDAVCAEMGLDPTSGSYVHCTCYREPARREWVTANGHDPKCGVARPNFMHKASGVRVDWYKYIGRSMEFKPVERTTWQQIIEESRASITKGAWVRPAPLTPEEEEAAYKAFEESVYVFEGSLPEVFQQIDETMRPVAVIERLETHDF